MRILPQGVKGGCKPFILTLDTPLYFILKTERQVFLFLLSAYSKAQGSAGVAMLAWLHFTSRTPRAPCSAPRTSCSLTGKQKA